MTLQIDSANFSGEGDRSPQSFLWLRSCDSTTFSGGKGRSPQSPHWLRHCVYRNLFFLKKIRFHDIQKIYIIRLLSIELDLNCSLCQSIVDYYFQILFSLMLMIIMNCFYSTLVLFPFFPSSRSRGVTKKWEERMDRFTITYSLSLFTLVRSTHSKYFKYFFFKKKRN